MTNLPKRQPSGSLGDHLLVEKRRTNTARLVGGPWRLLPKHIFGPCSSCLCLFCIVGSCVSSACFQCIAFRSLAITTVFFCGLFIVFVVCILPSPFPWFLCFKRIEYEPSLPSSTRLQLVAGLLAMHGVSPGNSDHWSLESLPGFV